MKRSPDRSRLFIASLAGLVVGACLPQPATLEGRACDPAGRCVEGYVCEPVSFRCLVADGGSPEVCDGLDNDLDGLTDEGLPEQTLFQDVDRDGFGAWDAPATLVCEGRPGWASEAGDCDDLDPARYPGAPDTVGDGVDQNCDRVDGIDGDGDGHASMESGGDDCLDTEVTCIADCTTDFDGDGPDCADFCVDVDGDGYGVTGGALGAACLGPDCDDSRVACTDPCFDRDADGLLDCRDPCVDADGDGWGRAGSDQSGCPRTGDDCDDTPNNRSDTDADNLCDEVDTCWSIYDPTNQDSDGNCPPPPYTQDPRCGDVCA